MKEFATFLRGRHASPRTIALYTSQVRRLLEWSKNDATEEQAEGYLRHLEERRLAPASISLAAYAIRIYFLFLKKELRLKPPPIKMKNPEYLSMEEVRALIKKASSPFSETLAVLLYDTGARISEILNLERADVNLVERTLRVTRKGGRTEKCRITSDGVEVLEKWMAEHKGKRIFTATYQQAYTELKVAAARAKIPHFHPHMLRHSRARHLHYIEGRPWEEVRDILGHVNVGVTMNVYGRMAIEDIDLPTWREPS